ncbi:S-adenosyl-L-methionine-dependent methyltransferase [Dacryopinax primogenitus]|uniref:S-adenosyl-L-methionine-dependent methyltransferase n=1 Tax=Dacryopinax primogenitus (strain DJM 731) TaxID=1858805 RepID=M5GBP1_DACPD|nr:S-adenosyl-L-methionine-dependent methyltransferase [Dacryopinax primogenitus]EJU06399.1 S-adenosyl-L-methionine-dependent methyltransferase [Dacryopinax primogenitus]
MNRTVHLVRAARRHLLDPLHSHSPVTPDRSVRCFATASGSINPGTLGPFQVFDRHAKRLQKDRAARADNGDQSRLVDYVRNEVADVMIERLQDIKRRFENVIDLGSGPGHLTKMLDREMAPRVTMIDLSHHTLHRDPKSEFEVDVDRHQMDEEGLLAAIPANSQDAVISCLSLHWINDLPGMLVQIKEVLKPDGVFLGALFGGDSLFELRSSLQVAEVEREGGISPRVSPMTQTQDMSNLMGRAGFSLLTVDIDEVKISYPSMWELLEDLKAMGEGNAVIGRRHYIPRDTLIAASAIYEALHGAEDGTVPATFQVIYVIGWKPSPTQPKSLERGSGQTNLRDVL